MHFLVSCLFPYFQVINHEKIIMTSLTEFVLLHPIYTQEWDLGNRKQQEMGFLRFGVPNT